MVGARQWQLRLDNHDLESVKVSLGDLYSVFSENPNELLHWKQYNYYPTYPLGYSIPTLLRWGRAIPAESTNPEFLFKNTYAKLLSLRCGLYRNLSKGDKHILKVLHIPCRNTQEEFDQQILLLCKLLVDSIDIKKVKTHFKKTGNDEAELKNDKGEDLPSLQVLEKWIIKNHIANDWVPFLKALQSMRSRLVAHKKPSNSSAILNKLINDMGITETNRTFPEIYYEILIKSTENAEKIISSLSDIELC